MTEESSPPIHSQWKDRSEIDYVFLFMSLWVSLNAWMSSRYTERADRPKLNLLKRTGDELASRFSDLLYADTYAGYSFRTNFGELHRALEDANIYYDRDKWQDKTITFSNCIIEWRGKKSRFESVIVQRDQSDGEEFEHDDGIELEGALYVDSDTDRLFAAYLEIVYQIRNQLFHGALALNPANERVIRHLYITLSMTMERI